MSLFHPPAFEAIDDVDERSRRRLRELTSDGESFVFGFVERDAVLDRHRTRVLLTDEKIVELERGWYFESTETYRLDKIGTVETERSGHAIEVDGTRVDGEFHARDPAVGRRFANAIREQVEAMAADETA
jgi:hypothetical protein